MDPEKCRSWIVVFNSYESRFYHKDDRQFTSIEANIDGGFKLVSPSAKMVRELSKIQSEKEILKFSQQYGIPCPNYKVPELTEHDLFGLLKKTTDNNRFTIGFDVLIKASDLESIQAELRNYRFCLRLAAALKQYPCLTNEEEAVFNEAVKQSKEHDLAPHDKAADFLAKHILAWINSHTRRRFTVQAPPLPIFGEYLTVDSPLAYAWVELADILTRSKPLNTCACCGTLFTSPHGDSNFCSPQCGNKYSKRLKRSQPEIMSRIEKGESIRVIAQALNFDEKYLTHMVNKWGTEKGAKPN